MTRTDRTLSSLRPLAMSQSVLSRADGSARFSFGDVTVMASVTGPTDVRIRDELVDRASLEINVRPLRGQAGPSSKAAEEQLLHLLTPFVLLHRYPRSLIQLTLQTLSTPSTAFTHAFSTALEIDDDRDKGKQANARRSLGVGAGAAESAARINAAMLALVDAGIECTSMLVAVAAAIVSPSQHDGSTDDGDDDELLLDPTPEEESRAKSTHVFVFAFGAASGNTPTRTESENDAVASAGDCVGAHSLGQFNAEQFFYVQELAQSACQAILAFVRRSIESRYGVEPPPLPRNADQADDDEEDMKDEP